MSEKLLLGELMRYGTLAAGLAALGGVFSSRPAARSKSPNEKLNIGCIGAGGKGRGDAIGVSSENIVALCDVDDARAAETYERFPNATKYQDFRKLLERDDIDAVTISTPDHTHAIATAMALRSGKHVYCQKPLTHSVYEARLITNLAAEANVATQMGNQGHSAPTFARLVEIIQSGAIGQVREVHAWTDRPGRYWPQGTQLPEPAMPVPSTLNWDLWLGPAPERPYNSLYVPHHWRGRWDFGTGSLGDMGCHMMDTAFWSLKLSYPVAVEAETVGGTSDSPPATSIVRYDFPERDGLPPVRLTWYDGGQSYPAELLEGEEVPAISNGFLFLGDKGKLIMDYDGEPILLPRAQYEGYVEPEPFIRRSPGHYEEWIAACKTGSPTGSHFGYAGPLTESVMLGNVAIRAGRKIRYDSAEMRVLDDPEANALLHRPYRAGWEL